MRGICRQVCRENGGDILRGVLPSEHVHMFVSVPPKLTIPDLMRKMNDRSSYRGQRECPYIRKRYRGVQVLGQGLVFNHQRYHYRRHHTSGP
ncbi:MAG: transposase [Paracoccus sp. (in: a-proteobacteria)]